MVLAVMVVVMVLVMVLVMVMRLSSPPISEKLWYLAGRASNLPRHDEEGNIVGARVPVNHDEADTESIFILFGGK